MIHARYTVGAPVVPAVPSTVLLSVDPDPELLALAVRVPISARLVEESDRALARVGLVRRRGER